MKLAATLSLLMALILGGTAFFQWKADAENAASNISKGYEAIRNNDEAGFQDQMREADARHNAEAIEAVAGAAFLVAAAALFGKSKPAVSAQTEAAA